MFFVAMKLKIYRSSLLFYSADRGICLTVFNEEHRQNIDKKIVYFYNETVNL